MKTPDLEKPISRRSLLTGLFALTAGRVLAKAPVPVGAKKFDGKYEMAIDVEIAKQDGFRVHRPYVAVWLEDKNGNSVRTLSLWVQTDRRGPRWIPDLRRWYRDAQEKALSAGKDLVQTVSSATREAGKYSLVWDGKDDAGKFVDQGEYTLFVEAAREHGTYQLITQKLNVGTKPFKQSLSGNVEIAGGAVELRKRK